MNSFDAAIISFLNQFAHRSWAFDSFVSAVGLNPLLKGALIPSLLWWAWFRPSINRTRDREFLLHGIASCVLSVLAARSLAAALPFRERPLLNPELHFQLPYRADPSSLIGWSSFPSDHAAAFFALAICILLVSRGAGLLALFHAFFIVSLPRVYMGIHYPTDIVAGALVGSGLALSANIATVRTFVARPALRWLERDAGTFYAFLFLLTYLITVTFDPLHKIGVLLFGILKAGLHHMH